MTRSPSRASAQAALAALLALALPACGKPPADGGIVVLCGGSFRPPVERLAQAFEAEQGIPVTLSFGQSEDLLPQVKLKAHGDVFITHDPFEQYVREAGALRRSAVVGHVAPVVVVPKGNPKGVKGFADLARPGLRVALPNPEYSTAGKMVEERLTAGGLKAAVHANAANALLRTHAEVANVVKIGSRDAGIIWNGLAHNWRDALEVVPEPYAYRDSIRVTVMGLGYSRRPGMVDAFVDFAAVRGEAIFREFGYVKTGGPDDGAAGREGVAVPAAGGLLLLCGAGLRAPIEEIVGAYRAEGRGEVAVDYAGSEKLLSRLKLSRRGDLFLPGESLYIDQAAKAGLVRSRRDICRWVPVILVAKGNPKGIRSLQDLARPGLKLGLGNPEACAIGRQTVEILRKNGLDPDAVYRQAIFQSLTVNELGLHVKLGTLDATLVWDAIASFYAEHAEAVTLPEAQNITTTVPVAVLATSPLPDAAAAFAAYLESDRAKEIFRKHHYTPAN
jgi:molybdate transport system substrate-binding protein